MGVYTHVAMGDLHNDVKSLPGIRSDGDAKTPAQPAASKALEPAPIPTDLAANWAALPDHIPQAITALANG